MLQFYHSLAAFPRSPEPRPSQPLAKKRQILGVTGARRALHSRPLVTLSEASRCCALNHQVLVTCRSIAGASVGGVGGFMEKASRADFYV
jgi:hypothetical protein